MCLQGIENHRRVKGVRKIWTEREKATSVAVKKNNVGHFLQVQSPPPISIRSLDNRK
jgi:hypothetical protein